MKRSTREWIDKAERDYLAALTLGRKRITLLHDAACFHWPQSAEKYLKARLEEAGIRVPKTHDLDALLSFLLPVEPLWASLRMPLLRLSDFAVTFRYPGSEATREDARTAARDAKLVRQEVRASLGLPA